MNGPMPSIPGLDVAEIASDLVDSIGDAADDLFTSDEERRKVEQAVRARLLDHREKLAALRSSTAQTETEGRWYQRAWRPAVMMVFAVVIVSHWFGIAGTEVTPEVQTYLYSVIKLGLGGYVLGRSGEKIAPYVRDAVRNRSG
jgi:hypothetical protein